MKKKKILIVEDEEIVAIDIKDMLIDMGYESAGIAGSKEETIRIIEKSKPDLVLMDIMLGHTDGGIEAAEEIRERFKVPVIYLTAYADDNTLDRAKSTAPYGYIIKPFQEKDLSTAIIMGLYKHEMLMKIKEETENALAAILGSVELMLEEAPKKHDRATMTKIEIIQKAANKIREYIERI